MVSFGFQLSTAAAALLVLLTTSVQPSPICPVAEGDSCKEVTFFLWTRSNPDQPQQVSAANISSSFFDKKHPTKVVIHGYGSGMDLFALAAIRREYLKLGFYNLISPSYLELVDSPCYLTAVINVNYVGKCIARFIRAMDVRRRPSTTMISSPPTVDGIPEVLDLHVIGFSLGAQTAAFTANHLRPEFRLDRISGLDPAFPFFLTTNKDRKLTEDDAEFVDVIHTNAYMQGQPSRCGDIDFYMNGGMVQPGCSASGFLDNLSCDHHRAPMYFAESIRSQTGLWGWPCESISDYEMGYCPAEGPGVLAGDWSDRRYTGFYVVQTRGADPFARGLWWAPRLTNTKPTSRTPSTLNDDTSSPTPVEVL